MSATGNPVPNTLFLFIDESGNFDFSSKGTKHFVMAGVAALAPLSSAASIQSLRYRLLAEGIDIEGFHASEDSQHVRNEVFHTLESISNIKAHAIYAEKKLALPSLQTPEQMHSLLGKALVKYAIKAYAKDDYDSVVVVFDKALTSKQRGVFHSIVKPELKTLGNPFHIYFHQMLSDSNGQIADYVSWSKFVQLERAEHRPWQALMNSVHPTDFNIFRNGTKKNFGGEKDDRPD